MSKRAPPQLISELVTHLSQSRSLVPELFFPDPVYAPTGSRVICDPAPTDTDDDWLVYAPEDRVPKAIRWLEQQGAAHNENQEHYPDGISLRQGDINVLLMWDYDTFYRWVAATHYAAKLNVTEKLDRKRMFMALVDATVPLRELIL